MIVVNRQAKKRQPPDIVGEVLIPVGENGPEVVLVSDEEGRVLFDYWAEELLGISGEEFLRRFDRGDYRGIEEDDFGRRYNRLVMMLPFVGRWPIPD